VPNEPQLSVAAIRPALLAGQPNTVDVLVRVLAPDTPATGLPERPCLNLAIVIDRSGSMAGQPLHEAKLCARFMIDNLKKSDRAGVVAYDDSVTVVVSSEKLSDKERFRAAIARLREGGSTNLHGGWLQGASEAADNLEPGVTGHVLLLSDGNANRGVTDVSEIASQCGQLAEKGVTTSTYGLGFHFNEQLMLEMARGGRGTAYYSETAESLIDRFREEFSLLASLCARDVRLRLVPAPGVRAEILNSYERNDRGEWRLPDLAYEGEVWAAVRLYIDKTLIPATGEAFPVIQARASYRDLEGTEHALAECWLSLPSVTTEQFQSVPEDLPMLRRVREAEAALLQETASRAAKDNNWVEVDRALSEARRLAAGNPWLSDIVYHLETLAAQRDQVAFSKEAMYSRMALGERQRAKSEFLAGFSDAAVPAYLRRKVRQGAKGHHGPSGASETYRLEIFDNHPVALIDGKRVLPDTGSPFSVGDGSRLRIAGQDFSFAEEMGVTPEKLSRWMNTDINALLGTDVLSQFSIELDWWSGELTFKLGGPDAPGGNASPC
jgi:Ca-activated chloride channel family protein